MNITNEIINYVNKKFDFLCENYAFRQFCYRNCNIIDDELYDFLNENFDWNCGVSKLVFDFGGYVIKLAFYNDYNAIEREVEAYDLIPNEIKSCFAQTAFLEEYVNTDWENEIKFYLYIADCFRPDEDEYEDKGYLGFLEEMRVEGLITEEEISGIANGCPNDKSFELNDYWSDKFYGYYESRDRCIALFNYYYNSTVISLLEHFLVENGIHDLHGMNVGFGLDGKPVIIDYAD